MDPLTEHKWLFFLALAVTAIALLVLRDWAGTMHSMGGEVEVESAVSRRLRQAAGVVSFLGLAVFILGGLAGAGDLAGLGILVFISLPYATMIAHTGITQCMNREEKAMWRRELRWSSHRSFVAALAYTFAPDLGARAREFEDSSHPRHDPRSWP